MSLKMKAIWDISRSEIGLELADRANAAQNSPLRCRHKTVDHENSRKLRRRARLLWGSRSRLDPGRGAVEGSLAMGGPPSLGLLPEARRLHGSGHNYLLTSRSIPTSQRAPIPRERVRSLAHS